MNRITLTVGEVLIYFTRRGFLTSREGNFNDTCTERIDESIRLNASREMLRHSLHPFTLEIVRRKVQYRHVVPKTRSRECFVNGAETIQKIYMIEVNFEPETCPLSTRNKFNINRSLRFETILIDVE